MAAAMMLAVPRATSAQAGAAAESPPEGEPAPTAQDARTLELGFVPLVGGDTDVGFGGGFLGSLARLDPAHPPYVFRLEGGGFITFKSAEGGITSPYQDIFFLLTVPGLRGGRARLEVRPSFTRETNLRYYGLGNTSPAPEREVPSRDFFQRTHPTLSVRGRHVLRGGLFGLAGVIASFSKIAFAPESNLARDEASTDPRVARLLSVDRRHALVLIETGLVFDTRDDEIAPEHGQFHHLKVRVSPALGTALPYQYVQADLTLRAYRPLVPDRLVLAGRLVGDLQAGKIPFYELSRFEEASALGGANGVRGIPGDRYLGQRKLFGNLEARLRLLRFRVLGSAYALGATGFADLGRVWAGLSPEPALDSRGLGLKYGLGGGLRVRKGKTFVVRFDLAWSPDARPLGAYFLGGHIF